MAKHWSERLFCQCGQTFRSTQAEARHRHNFPILCRKPRTAPRKRVKRTRRIEAQEPEAYCVFCKRNHPGGATCMGHYP